MFCLETWLEALQDKLSEAFQERMLFLGLQGSYRRGEAHETSDIDVVLVLDELGMNDLDQYRAIITSMPDADKACGFVAGLQELRGWPRQDAFQLYYDTRPIVGDLTQLLPPFDQQDAREAVRMGASGLYHALCHQYLHSEQYDIDMLQQCYKTAFFILQAQYFCKNGEFVVKKQALLEKLTEEESKLLQIGMHWSDLEPEIRKHPQLYLKQLIEWSSQLLKQTGTSRN